MNIENNDVLRGWLREHGYAALAELPSFEVPQEEYEKHLADVRAQGLHKDDEASNQARAVYRCLTTHLGGPEKRPEAQDSIATHLDRAARVFNQSVAVLAGKTEAHAELIDAARKEILRATAADAGAALQFMVKFYDKTEMRFHFQRSAIEAVLEASHATQELIRKRMAHLFWTIALGFALVLLLLGVLAVVGHAQAEKPRLILPELSEPAPAWESGEMPMPVKPAPKAAPKPEPAPNLAVPESYKLRIRDAQYTQDRILIRLQNLQLEMQKAQGESQNQSRTINDIVYQLALDNHLDLSKWVFDLDALAWRPKEK